MLVFWKERLVVLATPKTGSTALEAALGSLAALSVIQPPALKHTTTRDWQRYLRPYLEALGGEGFEAVALMREPIDWLGSWFRSRTRDDILDQPGATRGMSFESFATDYMTTPRPPHADVSSQAAFLTGLTGEPSGVDRLFRYEAIDDFTHFLEDRLGFPIELPRVNVSPKSAMALTEDTRERLSEVLADDYRLYNSIH